jgi:hypothetical protein
MSVSRRAHRRLGLAVGLVAALGLAPSALAAPPLTTITLDIEFEVAEEFTATGGVVCDHGFAVTDPFFFAGGGRQGRGNGTFHLIKTMICDDGEWFQIRVNAAQTRTGTIGGWSVVGGSDAYASLRGGGQIVGEGISETHLIDHYTGYLVD